MITLMENVTIRVPDSDGLATYREIAATPSTFPVYYYIGEHYHKAVVYLALRKTHDQYCEELTEKFNGVFEVVNEYEHANSELTFKHINCGNTFVRNASRMLYGKGSCPKCSTKGRRWTEREYIEYIEKEGKGEYVLLSKYTKIKDKVTIKHLRCGKTYTSPAQMFTLGYRCKSCSMKDWGATQVKKTEFFKKEVYALVGDEYAVVSEYSNAKEKVVFLHKTCGKTSSIEPDKFLRRNKRCDYCSDVTSWSTETFKGFVESESEGEYSLYGEYKTMHDKAQFIHFKCGTIYESVPNSFKRGHRCPSCKKSKGEDAVGKFLEANGLTYVAQYTFEDCRNKHRLRFDFCVVDNYNNALCLIEYDGKQHFELIDYFGEYSFIQTQENDRIKNEYCSRKGIPLIRIPYWEFDKGTLEEYLEKQIKSLKIAN